MSVGIIMTTEEVFEMGKAAGEFEFTLTQAEADEIRNAAGEGGHQGL